jgi:hypothetical protein
MAREEYLMHVDIERHFPTGLEWTDGLHGFPLRMLKHWVDRGDNFGSGGISSGKHDVIVSVLTTQEAEFRLKTYADVYKARGEKTTIFDDVPMEPMRFINITDIFIDRMEVIYDPKGCVGQIMNLSLI